MLKCHFVTNRYSVFRLWCSFQSVPQGQNVKPKHQNRRVETLRCTEDNTPQSQKLDVKDTTDLKVPTKHLRVKTCKYKAIPDYLIQNLNSTWDQYSGRRSPDRREPDSSEATELFCHDIWKDSCTIYFSYPFSRLTKNPQQATTLGCWNCSNYLQCYSFHLHNFYLKHQTVFSV